MTRHHAESNINILLTRDLPIDSGIRLFRGGSLKLDVQGQRSRKILDVDGQGVRGVEN